MDVIVRTVSRRYLALNLRDTYGLNALDRINLNEIQRNFRYFCTALKVVKRLMRRIDSDSLRYSRLKLAKKFVVKQIVSNYVRLQQIILAFIPQNPRHVAYPRHTFQTMEAELLRLGLTVSERFRFPSMAQLKRLIVAFRLPTGKIRIKTYVFKAEEILLISLTRLCWPQRWSDLYERFPGRKRWALGAAFYRFLD